MLVVAGEMNLTIFLSERLNGECERDEKKVDQPMLCKLNEFSAGRKLFQINFIASSKTLK